MNHSLLSRRRVTTRTAEQTMSAAGVAAVVGPDSVDVNARWLRLGAGFAAACPPCQDQVRQDLNLKH